MAVDFFLKIEGIPGESKDSKHAGEIDVLAFSWGLSQTGIGHSGGGGGAGKANFQDLSFTHHVDASSTALMYHCASGKHIPSATLVARKAGEKPLEYLKIKLTDILVTSVSTGGSGGEERQTANVTLNFSQVVVDYTEQKADGSGAAAKNFGWSVLKNAKV
ncbi:Hcp family type VI secretion system effector [Rhodoferax sp.]|uniref:Hcp family type VI secretion system effector n=1 Tax=Rhodoferax sp. TaxID=50421 RepID=UPI00374DCDE5